VIFARVIAAWDIPPMNRFVAHWPFHNFVLRAADEAAGGAHVFRGFASFAVLAEATPMVEANPCVRHGSDKRCWTNYQKDLNAWSRKGDANDYHAELQPHGATGFQEGCTRVHMGSLWVHCGSNKLISKPTACELRGISLYKHDVCI
jgi:hypothetical protein